MYRRLACAVVLSLYTVACTPQIEYAPGTQKKMPEGVDLAVPMLHMSDPMVRSHTVQDVLVGEAGSQWFWTNQHPRFQLAWDEPETGWDFEAEFTVADVVLKQVGPVTVTFLLNDQPIGKERYPKDGTYKFHAPVKPEILRGHDKQAFGMDVDPVYIAPGDGAKLGLLLQSIGFRKATLSR